MHLGGKFSLKNHVVLMGAMTAVYGIGQVSVPLYSVALVESFGDYKAALFVTVAIVFSGVVLLVYAKTKEPRT